MFYGIIWLIFGTLAFTMAYVWKVHKEDTEGIIVAAFMAVATGPVGFAIMLSIVLGIYIKSQLTDQLKS